MSADYRHGSNGRRRDFDGPHSGGPNWVLITIGVLILGGVSAWLLRDRFLPSSQVASTQKTSSQDPSSRPTSLPIPGPDEHVEDFSLPGPASSEEYRAELAEALRESDICRIVTELRPESRPDIPPGEILETFFETVSGMRPAKETTSFRMILGGLLESDPKNAIERLRSSTNKNPRLYLSLVQSGMMDGMPLDSDRESYKIIDYANASAALKVLSDENPKNSAFPFFLAGVRHRMNAPKSELERLFKDSFKRPKFKTALYKVARDLGRLSGESEAHALVSTYLQAMIPAPNYNEPADLLISMINERGNSFATKALGFGRKMMAINEPYIKAVPNPIKGVREEYETGARIAQAAWQRLNPQKSFLNEGPEDLRSSVILETAAAWDAKWSAAVGNKGRAPATECPREALRDLLQNEQQEFAEFYKDYVEKWK